MPRLTARKVENAKAGRYTDGEGLMLYVSPSGGRSWVLRVQVSGRRREIGLGSVSVYDALPEIKEIPLMHRRVLTLAEARLKAATLRQIARSGRDPLVELGRDLSPIPTFAEAMRRAYDAKLPEWSSKTASSFLSSMEQHVLPFLGKQPVNEIDAALIAQILSKIWTSQPPTARKVRQRIGLVLNFSEAQRWRATSMPDDAVSLLLPKQKEGGHFDAMPYQEVPNFVRILRYNGSVGYQALLFLIYTAARSGEVRGARWNQIHLADRLWHRPAELMKGRNARPHTVTLNSQAIELLEMAKQLRRDESGLIFPGRKGKLLSDMTLSAVMSDISGTPHGFRSSFRDWAAEKMPHIPDPVAEAALAHKVDNKVVAAYKRTNFLEMRHTLLCEWGRFCASSL